MTGNQKQSTAKLGHKEIRSLNQPQTHHLFYHRSENCDVFMLEIVLETRYNCNQITTY